MEIDTLFGHSTLHRPSSVELGWKNTRTKRTTTKSVLRISRAIALLASVYFLDIFATLFLIPELKGEPRLINPPMLWVPETLSR